MTTPIDTTRLRAGLEALAAKLATQDNHITEAPVYCVQQSRRVYGIESDYTETFVWIFDGEEMDPAEWSADNDGAEFFPFDPPRGWEKVGYQDRWEFVQAFLTEDAANAYMKSEAHNLTTPRLYVAPGYRNTEWQTARTLPAQALALLDEVERLRARLAEAYPRALQAAANEVSECAAQWRMDEDGEPPDLDAVVDRILEMDADAIDEFARQCALDHEAATVADHFVCPGCHAVDDDPCLPGCIDAEIEGERRRPFDGFSEFNADDEGDEGDEGDEPEEASHG